MIAGWQDNRMTRFEPGKVAGISMLLVSMLLTGCGGDKQCVVTDGKPVELTMVMDLDSTSIAAFCEAGTTAILEFGGKRCISCMEMRGNLEDLRTQYPSLRVGYVYWEVSPELFEKWDVGLIPAQIVLDASGKEISRHKGIWEVAEMQAVIQTID
jgi:hypothetical protein